jgi:hypothetical protein
MKINNKKISLQNLYLKLITCQEAEIRGLLRPVQANLGLFLAWFQSAQLPPTQFESPIACKSNMSFKVCIQL